MTPRNHFFRGNPSPYPYDKQGVMSLLPAHVRRIENLLSHDLPPTALSDPNDLNVLNDHNVLNDLNNPNDINDPNDTNDLNDINETDPSPLAHCL